MSQLKVLFLAHSYIREIGDLAGPFLHNLAKRMVAAGERVYVLAPHKEGLLPFEKIEGVEIHRFRYAPVYFETLAYVGNMDERVKENWVNKVLFAIFLLCFFAYSLVLIWIKKINIIYAHWWVPGGLVGWLVSLITARPLLVTLHGTDYRVLKKYMFLKPLAKLIFGHAKYVTVVSSFMKDYLVESKLVSEYKIRVLPLPVEIEKFKPQKLIKKDKKTILCVAKFTRQKGVDYLIEASKILLDKKFDFEVKIIGGGPEHERFEKKVGNLGLSQRVFLFDRKRQQELPFYYGESDVVVLPSKDEGFGLVLVEAQLCQRPVIGTNSGGIPDIIEDGVTGLLVKPEDPYDLAKAIERIFVDQAFAKKLAGSGYQSAVLKFSPEAIQNKFLELLKQMI